MKRSREIPIGEKDPYPVYTTNTKTITRGGQTLEAYIHPDCAKLLRKVEKPVVATGKEDPTFWMSTGRQIIEMFEKLDHPYNQPSSKPNRLTLRDIDQLLTVIPNDEEGFKDALEAAFVREKLVTIGLKQAANLALQGTITETVLNGQDSLTAVAIAGAIGVDILSEPVKEKFSAYSLKKLLTKALQKCAIAYDISQIPDSDLNDREEFASFIQDVSGDLTTMNAMQSEIPAVVGSTLVNSSVLIANRQFLQAGIYAGVGIATAMGGEKYKQKLRELGEYSRATPLREKVRQMVTKIAGRSIQGSANYLPNILSVTGLAGKNLEIALNLATFMTLNEVEEVAASPDKVERESIIEKLHAFINWAQYEANELVTPEEYHAYCEKKREELVHDRTVDLELPDRNFITGQTAPMIQMIPGQVQKEYIYNRNNNPTGFNPGIDGPAIIDYRFINADPFDASFKKPEKGIVKKYNIIDAALMGKHTVRPSKTDRTPETAVVFANIQAGFANSKMFLRDGTLVAEPGYLTELAGDQVSTSLLEILAEQKRNLQGTTYIRTKDGDINVHLDEDPSELYLYNCDKSQKTHSFFQGMEKLQIITLLNDSNLFTDDEMRELNNQYRLGHPITPTSRTMDRLFAVIEALNQDKTVTILNYPFRETKWKDQIRIADYLRRAAKDRIIIIRGDDKAEDIQEDRKKSSLISPDKQPAYRRHLANTGDIMTYNIEDRRFVQSVPPIAEIVRQLEDLDIPSINQWSLDTKESFARELANNLGRLELKLGEPVREIEVIRGDIFATHNNRRYRLIPDYKIVEKADSYDRVDRSADSHSIHRSKPLGTDPRDTLKLRLTQMGWDTIDINQIEFDEVDVIRPSGSYPQLNTHYHYSDTSFEVPYKENVFGKHDSGGIMVYKWEEVPPNAQESTAMFDPSI